MDLRNLHCCLKSNLLIRLSTPLFALTISHICVAANTATSDRGIEKTLLSHISNAQKNLADTEQRIANERQRFSHNLNTLEREVIELQKKTATARRLSDEKTLSLSQLEARLDSWQQQNVFQKNLLHRYLQQYGNLNQQSSSQTTSEQLHAVVDSSKNLNKRFTPQWVNTDIIGKNGEIKSLPTLSIGPITWYLDGDTAGLASNYGNNSLKSDLLFSGDESKAILDLRSQTSGEIIFDPTLTRAMARQQHSESLLEHLAKGGLWAIPILLFAAFALSIALIKVVQLWRLPKVVAFSPAALTSVLQNSTAPQAASVQGMQRIILEIGANEYSPRQRDDLLFMKLHEDKHTLEKWLGAIAITAAVSPLLGLLGTVSGMIETFKMMTLFGSGDPEVVSGGIAQALITTELGLVVAIPALLLNAILSRKAKNYYNALESFAILISKSDEQETAENHNKSKNQKMTQDHINPSQSPRTSEGVTV